MDLRFPAFLPAAAVPAIAALTLTGLWTLIALPAAHAADTYTAVRKTNVSISEVYGGVVTVSQVNNTIGADVNNAFFRAGGTSVASTGFRSFTSLAFANAAFGLPAGATIEDITGISLDFNALQQAGAPAFQGSLELFLVSNTGPLDAALRYNQANAAPNGIPTTTTTGNNGGQNLGNIFSLGTVSAATLPTSGAVSLSLSSLNTAGKDFLIQALNSGQDLRLVVAAADATSVAAWQANNTVADNRPTFSITATTGSGTVVVPEAGTATLLSMAGMFASAGTLVVRRRRRCNSSKA